MQLAKDERVRKYARKLLARQGEELVVLLRWRQNWYPNLPANPNDGKEEQRVSESVPPGPEPYDARWIATIVQQHRGAIRMTQDLQTQLAHSQLNDFGDSLITVLSGEIEQLKTWSAGPTGWK